MAAPGPERAVEPGVRIGTVRVLPGFNGAVVRAAPSLSGRVVTSIAIGGRVQVLEDTASGDGLRWVQVRTSDGTTGWMSAQLLEISES